jgi:hypothetical protein
MALKAVSAPLGSPVGGSGTPGTIPVWSSGTTLGNSPLIVNGTNVGLGTASAAARFHIVTPDGSPYPFALAGTTKGLRIQTTASQVQIDGVDSTLVGSYQPLFLNGSTVTLATGGSARVTTDASGNVGIGTPSPGRKLEISASAPLRMGTGGEYFDFLQYTPGTWAWLSSAGQYVASWKTSGGMGFGGVVAPAANTVDVSTSGWGLKLPATPDNADTRTLDCYQENYASNSWTPVIFGGTTAGTATYSVQEGFYTRWGNLIFCTATVVFSGHTGTGNLSLSGLPFAAKTAGSGTYRSSIIIEEGGGVKAILRLQSGTTATTTGVSIAASGNYVITFVYATN